MERGTKSALRRLLNNAIKLAEISQSEVRVIFQSVTLTIKPGQSVAELMAEFERMENRFAGVANEIATMFQRVFMIDDLRRMVAHMEGGRDLMVDAPSDKLPPREQFAGFASLLCRRRVVFTRYFWGRMKWTRPRRIGDVIEPIERMIEREFGLT